MELLVQSRRLADFLGMLMQRDKRPNRQFSRRPSLENPHQTSDFWLHTEGEKAAGLEGTRLCASPGPMAAGGLGVSKFTRPKRKRKSHDLVLRGAHVA